MKPTFSMPSSRSRIEGAALLAVIALLCVLAMVQHRWLGAIAEAERRKLGEEAAEKAQAIAQEVDRELTSVFLELRIDLKALPGRAAQGGAGKADSTFAEQFKRWHAESPHAGLVKAVFVAERSAQGPSRLLRFDPTLGSFVEESWPGPLDPVRAVIDAPGDRALPLPISVVASLPSVMAEVPALLSPVVDVVVSERMGALSRATKVSQIREMFMHHAGRAPVQILLLDDAYLRDRLVSAIARSRLGSEGPFEWLVVKTADGTAVAGLGQAGVDAPVDAKSPLLRLRFDDLDRSLLRGVLPGLSEAASEASVRLVVQVGGPNGGVQGSPVSVSSAPWTLRIRHQEGSIDAAVRGQQRLNTALSASILGVLGMAAGLVFFSARRLRAIAAQQVEFVAAVSHELRTPLAVIRSAADNLADGVVHDKDQAKRYGALIRAESVRLTDMVEHVLEFAGADSPGRAARGPINAVDAARSAVLGMEGLAAERQAAVVIEAPPDPIRANGDLSHLTRAISNLVGNALKYGGDPPRVIVRVRRVPDGVEITVTDHGHGLDRSEILRLFEPFYRGQRASEAHIPGSGLGLALVKRIVESHGGRVDAKNAPQGGAVFTVVLPEVRSAAS